MLGGMRVFISSVRTGLEAERDALPALIEATGHEAVRFEDFGAQPEPSREVCIAAVRSSDVYVLLLGPNYGYVFPETGQSATHDEWVAAVQQGMPKLVFRKNVPDGETEPRQAEFIETVRDYATGVFYATYGDVADLMPQVVEKLRELAAAPNPLTYQSLASGAATFSWRTDWEPDRSAWGTGGNDRGVVELHIVPLDGPPRPGRVMRAISDNLVGRLREFGALSASEGVEPRTSSTEAVVELPEPPRTGSGIGETYESRLRGVRLDAAGQLSVWWTLPGDSMAGILDPAELTKMTAEQLRLAGATGLLDGERFAVAIGLAGSLMMVAEGKVTGVPRSSASFGMNSDAPVRVLPDESVSASAFDRGAEEVARTLVDALLEAFRNRR
jgi:hypothetical protein